MANIVITSTTNSIKVDFGDYSSSLGFSKGTWKKNQIIRFKLVDGTSCVEALPTTGNKWTLVYSASGNFLIVDSVDGVAPTSNSDLYDKLIALIA